MHPNGSAGLLVCKHITDLTNSFTECSVYDVRPQQGVTRQLSDERVPNTNGISRLFELL